MTFVRAERDHFRAPSPIGHGPRAARHGRHGVTDSKSVSCVEVAPVVSNRTGAAEAGLNFAILDRESFKRRRTSVPTGPVFDSELLPQPIAVGNAEVCSCALASASGPLSVYNEEAFRHFFAIERKRSKASNRPFFLVLVDVKDHTDSPALAGRLFEALEVVLRETDFIGWYREGEIVGAVLTEHGTRAAADTADAINRRVTRALTESLPHTLADRLQLRVYQVPPALQGVGE